MVKKVILIGQDDKITKKEFSKNKTQRIKHLEICLDANSILSIKITFVICLVKKKKKYKIYLLFLFNL